MNTSSGTPSRTAVLETLRRVNAGAHFDAALDVAARHLNGPDRALAMEISAGCLRERRWLDRLIDSTLTDPGRKLPDDVRDILRSATYQLARLDRVPSHAVVDSAVHLIRDRGHDRFAGLTNAVLRKLATAIPTLEPGTLAEEWSHPDWMVHRWTEAYGLEKTAIILQHNNRRPDLHLQPVGDHESRLRAALNSAQVEYESTWDGTMVLTGSPTTLPGYQSGWFFVQDVTQKRLLDHASIPSDTTVWDACAAPGGKSMALADRRVFASDRKLSRVKRVRDNTDRIGRKVDLFVADLNAPPLAPESQPVVLVDAPCSGTGTFARHPDARWRLTADDIERLVAQQIRLLDAASSVVQPGGRLVYLTCSIEPEENGNQVEQFLNQHTDFERTVPDRLILPGDGADGGFAAALKRRA